jgi:hypothetical protein
MERPVDGHELDSEGFIAIIVGEDHKLLVDDLGARLSESLAAVERLRDSLTPVR